MDRYTEIADNKVGDVILCYKDCTCVVPKSSLRERTMRVRCVPHLAWHSQYLHEYKATQVAELFSRERLGLYGLLEHINGDWASRSLNAVCQEPNRLVGVESILGTWFPPEDFISRAWFIETPMVISMAQQYPVGVRFGVLSI